MFPNRESTKEDYTAATSVVVKTHARSELHSEAKRLGRLKTLSTDAPRDSKEYENGITRWIVIGRTSEAVYAKITEINRKAKKAKKRAREEEEETWRKRQRQVIRAAGKGQQWDVTGSWKISCPHIEDGWHAEDLTLKIYTEDTEKGPQMFAEFDFGAISGVFRFERQGGEDGQTKDDDDNADEEDDSEEESDDEEDRMSPTPEAFYLGSTTQPSANSPARYYRWRGEEQGEGEIELESDENLYKITFRGSKGTKLAGTFGGGAFGDCEFTGIKVGTGGPPNIDIAEEWANRSESAHDMAQTDRWY